MSESTRIDRNLAFFVRAESDMADRAVFFHENLLESEERPAYILLSLWKIDHGSGCDLIALHRCGDHILVSDTIDSADGDGCRDHALHDEDETFRLLAINDSEEHEGLEQSDNENSDKTRAF